MIRIRPKLIGLFDFSALVDLALMTLISFAG
jgi:hypothetical protein